MAFRGKSCQFYISTEIMQGRSGGVQKDPWNPPFERASFTRDILIEQSNQDQFFEEQCSKLLYVSTEL